MNLSRDRLMRLTCWLALLSLLAFGTAGRASASSIIYVKSNATGANNGTSWKNAYQDLQVALGAAVSGDQIWVAAGTYRPTDKTSGITIADRQISFVLANGVPVYGGFAGTETLLSQRNWKTNVTILSGNIGASGDAADNSYHVVVASGTNSTAVLDGFKILGGHADGAFPYGLGGALYMAGGSPTLRNLIVVGNFAAGEGGGVYADQGSSPSLTDVTIANNSAHDGGGMMNSYESGSPTLTHVTFKSNSAQYGGGLDEETGFGSVKLNHVEFNANTAGIEGGGMYNFAGTPTLTHVSFVGNSSAGGGGGMYDTDSATPILSQVVFSNNSALGDGGGIYNTGSSPTLTNVSFAANTANNRGGGMFNDGSSPTLDMVVFSGNHATTSAGGGLDNENSSSPSLTHVVFASNVAIVGGGMNNYLSDPTLTDVTFATNSAYDGGGMRNASSVPSLTNVTFSGNIAGNNGGAMFNGAASPTLLNVTFAGNAASASGGALYNLGSNPQLANSIFWGDGTSEISDDVSSVPSVVDDLIQGGCPSGIICGNVISGNPALGLLKNNGGFTRTLALGPGSAAIDAGGTDRACASTDQRGVARPQGAACDIGAYEVKSMTFVSQAAYDGWVLESGKGTNVGGSLNAAGATLLVGDNKLNRRYRSLLSFNTAKLPDKAIVVRANLQVVQQSLAGSPFTTQGNLLVDLAKPYFGAELGLVSSDWQAPATVSPAGAFSFSLSTLDLYTAPLNKTARAGINRLGTTQFRLRFTTDLYNGAADYLALYSGNALTATKRPRLVVYFNP